MFSTDAMVYGTFPLQIPIPTDFDGVYPTACGYHTVHTPVQVSSGAGGLLVWILSGEGAARLGEDTCNYIPGCGVIAVQADQLTLYPQEKTEYLYLLLQHADGLLAQLGAGGFVRAEAADSRADRLLGRICYNVQSRQLNTVYAASADTYTLLMELSAAYAPDARTYSPLVRQAMDIMREEYALLTGVDELADRLGVTKNHLIRSFTASAAISPGKYLQEVKLDNAKLMLQNRDYTIEMIADMTGYSGANYFCKVFRRATGETPGEYRARHLAPPALDADSRRRIMDLESLYHV